MEKEKKTEQARRVISGTGLRGRGPVQIAEEDLRGMLNQENEKSDNKWENTRFGHLERPT